MAAFTLDTSCMVAALCTWHEHHERAATEINRRLRARQTMVVAAPALVETYAVLTRLPSPHRLAPSDASRVMDASFVEGHRVVALPAAIYVALLRRVPDEAVSGGRVYDAVLAQCAITGRASSLLTFNARHFESLAVPALEIVVP